MRRFKRILLHSTEGAEESAVPWVARLAAAAGAELTLTDVVEPLPAAMRRFAPRGWDIPKLVRAEKAAHLEAMAARVRRVAIDPEIAILSGQTAKALVTEVVRGGYDLLATDAPSARDGEAVVTTAVDLVRQAPCPVLLARSSRRRKRPRVLIAIDAGTPGTKASTALNRTLIETGLWLAESLGGDVYVLHVWKAHSEHTLRRSGVASIEIKQFVSGFREQAMEALGPSLKPFRDRIPPARIHLQKGDPRVEIPRFALARQADLLVIGTASRKGLLARVVGNTAEALLTRLPCSMLVMKPVTGSGRRRRRA